MAVVTGTTPLAWTQNTHNYTANKTTPLLIFAIGSSNATYIVLDDISVVDTHNSSIQLLANPGFENSSTIPIDWTVWCTSSCVNGTGGTIISSGCHNNTGNCYKSQCNGGFEYIGQTFSATIGRIYTVSFWYQRVRIVTGGTTENLDAGII